LAAIIKAHYHFPRGRNLRHKRGGENLAITGHEGLGSVRSLTPEPKMKRQLSAPERPVFGATASNPIDLLGSECSDSEEKEKEQEQEQEHKPSQELPRSTPMRIRRLLSPDPNPKLTTSTPVFGADATDPIDLLGQSYSGLPRSKKGRRKKNRAALFVGGLSDVRVEREVRKKGGVVDIDKVNQTSTPSSDQSYFHDGLVSPIDPNNHSSKLTIMQSFVEIGPNGEVTEKPTSIQGKALFHTLIQLEEQLRDQMYHERLFLFLNTWKRLRKHLSALAKEEGQESKIAKDWLKRLDADKDIAQAVDKANFGEEVLQMFQRSDGEKWTMVRDKEQVTTWYREEQDSKTLTFLVQGPIDPPLINLAACLYEVDMYSSWFPFLKRAVELDTVSRFHKHVHITVKAPWPVWDREVFADCYGVNCLHDGELLICLRPLLEKYPPGGRKEKEKKESKPRESGMRAEDGGRGRVEGETEQSHKPAEARGSPAPEEKKSLIKRVATTDAAVQEAPHKHEAQHKHEHVRRTFSMSDVPCERLSEHDDKWQQGHEERRKKEKVVLADVKWGGFRIRKDDEAKKTTISMLANVDPKLEVVSPALLNFIAARLFHYMLVFLNKAASFSKESKYARRIKERPEIYKYIQSQIDEAKQVHERKSSKYGGLPRPTPHGAGKTKATISRKDAGGESSSPRRSSSPAVLTMRKLRRRRTASNPPPHPPPDAPRRSHTPPRPREAPPPPPRPKVRLDKLLRRRESLEPAVLPKIQSRVPAEAKEMSTPSDDNAEKEDNSIFAIGLFVVVFLAVYFVTSGASWTFISG